MEQRALTDSDKATSYGRLWWLGAIGIVVFGGHLALASFAGEDALAAGAASAVGASAWNLALLLAGLGLAMLAWRIVLAARYRPIPSVSDFQLPVVTVIVPAYNEGAQVLETIRSLAKSDYPCQKLSIVAVDDGSRDDTWEWIREGGKEFPGLVQTVRCRVNRGKRQALHEGIKRSRGQVIVTVDSDSEVAPDTLRNLVSPFVTDARVGAVAGNVRVLNEGGPFSRMLDVVFTFGFDFIRAGQSEVNTVFCTPGALSAYRRDLVLGVLDRWIEQTFLGRQANIGEDRAMTNLILRSGYHVKFQGNANVWTEVPTRWLPLSRMLLRWARSNVRETLVMSRYIFTSFRPGPALGARIHFVSGAAALLLAAVWWIPLLALLVTKPVFAVSAVMLGSLLAAVPSALVFALLRTPQRAGWAFAYAAFSLIGLSWITPYAFLSLRKNGWLTRQIPVEVVPTRVRRAATAA